MNREDIIELLIIAALGLVVFALFLMILGVAIGVLS